MKLSRQAIRKMILKEMREMDHSLPPRGYQAPPEVSEADMVIAASAIGNVLHGTGHSDKNYRDYAGAKYALMTYFENLLKYGGNVRMPGKYADKVDNMSPQILNTLKELGLDVRAQRQLEAFADEVMDNIRSRES